MTPKQLAVLHLARKHMATATPGFNDDMWRAILVRLGGAKNGSATELDNAGFEAVMEYANAWGFQSTWRQRTFGHRPGMASPRQVDLILELWREWSGADDKAALDKWIERYYGIASLRFATPPIAAKAINGLKAMIARKTAKAG